MVLSEGARGTRGRARLPLVASGRPGIRPRQSANHEDDGPAEGMTRSRSQSPASRFRCAQTETPGAAAAVRLMPVRSSPGHDARILQSGHGSFSRYAG